MLRMGPTGLGISGMGGHAYNVVGIGYSIIMIFSDCPTVIYFLLYRAKYDRASGFGETTLV